MKAIVYDKNNPTEKLTLREVAKPTPQAGEVLVKIIATSVNAADYRSMRMGAIPKHGIFGGDVAGRVEALGSGVTTLKVGDAVLGDITGCGSGGFAEYVAVPAAALSRKPDWLSFSDAAALPLASVTALQGLRNSGELQSGESVLVVGAGGGVGTYAVQLAGALGARVTAVCGPHNVEMVSGLGAQRVLDYTREDFLDSGERYDLILVVNGSRPLSEYRRGLAPRGRLVIAGGDLRTLFKAMLFGWLYSLGGQKIRVLSAKPCPKDTDLVVDLMRQGKVKPVIERIYPLAETPAAVAYLDTGHARGKVLINVSEE